MRSSNKARWLRWVMNCWPSFFGAGIKVIAIAPDFRFARVRLRLGWRNRNYFGTHFGGNLFAMTDPFWAILLFENLGRDYVVWDKRAEIEFVKALKDDVFAEFLLTPELVAQLKQQADTQDKVLHWFVLDVKTASGEIAARVRKQVYVRRKAAR